MLDFFIAMPYFSVRVCIQFVRQWVFNNFFHCVLLITGIGFKKRRKWSSNEAFWIRGNANTVRKVIITVAVVRLLDGTRSMNANQAKGSQISLGWIWSNVRGWTWDGWSHHRRFGRSHETFNRVFVTETNSSRTVQKKKESLPWLTSGGYVSVAIHTVERLHKRLRRWQFVPKLLRHDRLELLQILDFCLLRFSQVHAVRKVGSESHFPSRYIGIALNNCAWISWLYKELPTSERSYWLKIWISSSRISSASFSPLKRTWKGRAVFLKELEYLPWFSTLLLCCRRLRKRGSPIRGREPSRCL